MNTAPDKSKSHFINDLILPLQTQLQAFALTGKRAMSATLNIATEAAFTRKDFVNVIFLLPLGFATD
jgi:hypothetical protein